MRLQARCVLLLDVPFPASQFSSVHGRKALASVRRVRRFARASAARCIRHAPVLLDRAPSESVRAFRLRDRLVLAAAQVRLRVGPASAMFPVA